MKNAILPLLLLIFVACTNADGTPAAKEQAQRELAPPDIDTPPDPQSFPAAEKPVKVMFTPRICEKLMDHETWFVELSIDGKKTIIDTVMACERIPRSGFAACDIPSDAVTACGGWWAGAGDYFYAVIRNNRVVVYQGWQDEQQEDDGYHWKQIKY